MGGPQQDRSRREFASLYLLFIILNVNTLCILRWIGSSSPHPWRVPVSLAALCIHSEDGMRRALYGPGGRCHFIFFKCWWIVHFSRPSGRRGSPCAPPRPIQDAFCSGKQRTLSAEELRWEEANEKPLKRASTVSACGRCGQQQQLKRGIPDSVARSAAAGHSCKRH